MNDTEFLGTHLYTQYDSCLLKHSRHCMALLSMCMHTSPHFYFPKHNGVQLPVTGSVPTVTWLSSIEIKSSVCRAWDLP